MQGTPNATELQNLVNEIDASHAITGTPGHFIPPSTSAVGAAGPTHGGALAVAAPAATILSTNDNATVKNAIDESNKAAAAHPDAGSGNPTGGSTTATTISGILGSLSGVSSTASDFKQLEAGATATLHWWGWSAELDDSATNALESILTNDSTAAAAILAALAALSAPLAAVAAIVKAAGTGLETWISHEDSGNGVLINGYLWVGVWVESLS